MKIYHVDVQHFALDRPKKDNKELEFTSNWLIFTRLIFLR